MIGRIEKRQAFANMKYLLPPPLLCSYGNGVYFSKADFFEVFLNLWTKRNNLDHQRAYVTQVIPVILESCSAGSLLNYLALIHPPCWVKALPCLFGGLQGPISSLAVAVGFTFLAMKYGSGDGVDSKRTPGWGFFLVCSIGAI
ncbi:hypothetical protein D5086_000078 [Populus alba]|uniref:Uncharacterized protein n=1 Tax=Populus alba TaxID=43335 RepID=A0ACC4CVC1_POPAL